MHRRAADGGLGVHNVQLKAQAGLIRTFLETASNPFYRRSLYHSLLFRYHVLGETSLPDPGTPPFYSPEFFAKIRQVHLESPLNVSKMTEKEWYQVLLEDMCIMEVDEEGNRQRLMEAFTQLMHNIPMGAERIHRIRFRDNFDKFIVNVRGFLFVK